MIIPNGTIEVKAKSGGGIDPTTGHPIGASFEWESSIPCQYIPIAHDKQAVSGGEHYTLATYMVLVEEQPFCVTGEQVRMKDKNGDVVGEYSVRSIEYLEAVCETKITI